MKCTKKKIPSNPIDKMLRYINMHLKNVGVKLVYTALLLFYAYKREDTPGWAKRIIIGSVAYFLSPIDAIPDLSPFLGFTDDIGVLTYGLVAIACYINDDVKEKAKLHISKFFVNIDESDLIEVDAKL